MRMRFANAPYERRACCTLRCRNTPFFRKICHSKRQIQQSAKATASGRPTARDRDTDGIPLVKPISCRRDRQAPTIIKLPSLREEALAIADHLASAHKEGHAWGDMAVLCADWKTMELCADALHQRNLPFNVRSIQVTTTPQRMPSTS